ncbi:fimbrial biogenesis chaperone [Terricaulis silvestris]|uniref:Pili assembly chaperone N-terminal domain-containing protein n=1 Tax=Terricaulis silvestris TaxID=2686094 RepID=A0A6I6MJ31_9CAUL|nr:fimbria/pilus periplasmic chaperone [Terricaulis silvestris]QGZ93831.1 hypothetical protein DSM104635_00645 [Terricaulis silvestris]
MSRSLVILAIGALAASAPAEAQTGGIQVAPVMIVMTGDHNITSLRVRNGRARPVAFEIDAYEWRQENGEDILTPTQDLLLAPGVFEIAPETEQVVRLGVVTTAGAAGERSYRIIMRELPALREGLNVLGFSLEMSLPVFVRPEDARGSIQTSTLMRDGGRVLQLTNTGRAHAQIGAVEDMDAGALEAPRYLLAGTSVEIALPLRARTIRVRASEAGGSQTERLVHVEYSDDRASLR